MTARSNETILILQALKRLHTEMAEVRERLVECKEAIARIESGGGNITLNLNVPEDDESDASADSAPF